MDSKIQENTQNNIPASSPYSHTEKKLENAQVELTITIPKDIVQKTYKKIIKELQKEANIKGFRKGHIPESVLLNKFSDYIRAKFFDSIANEAFTAVIPSLSYPPLSYATPKAVNLDEKTPIVPTEDFSFTLIYDRYPDIELASTDTLTLTTHNIQISEDDIQKELKILQEQNTFSVEKQGAAEEGNIVIGSYIELDAENTPIEDTKNEKYTITLGASKAQHEKNISDALIGKKVSDTIHVPQEFSEEYEIPSLAGRSFTVEITVQNIQERKKPDINDELAQDINEKYETLDALKKDITTQLQERAETLQFSSKQQTILSYLKKESTIEIPQSAVQLQLNSHLKRFAQQSGTDVDTLLSTLQKTKEELTEVWRADAIVQVTEQFIIAKMIEQAKVKTSSEEAEEILRKEAETHERNADEIIDYYKKNNLMQQIQYEQDEKKAFNAVIQQCKEEKGTSLSLSEYIALQEKEAKDDHDK